MLDFLPKLVIIEQRIVPLVLKYEGLGVLEREVFIDVFKAATVQKNSIQRNNAKTCLPEVSWYLPIEY
jgi:hypothetical protein